MRALLQAIHTPQTDRKHFLLYCAKYHQPPPFFIDVITTWREALCGSRCRVTGTMVSMVITMIYLGYTCHKYPTLVRRAQLGPKKGWDPQESGFVNDWI